VGIGVFGVFYVINV